MDKKLRLAIVGCGVIAQTHARAIASLPDAELVAVADIDPARAQALATQYGATPYTDVQTMLDRERLDLVNICTPSGLHGLHAVQVMRTGRHVIVEKPMELRREAIDEMLRVRQEAGVLLAVISQHRFDPASKQVRALVDEHAFGRLVLGQAIVPWWRSQAYYDSGGWRGTAALDGGVLMNQAIHSVDLLQWLMGPVSSVCAYTDTLSHRMETEDVAVAVLRFANGALGTLAATTGAYPGAATRIEIYGENGSAVIENDRLKWLHLAEDDREPVGPYGLNISQSPEEAEQMEGTVAAVASNPAALLTDSHTAQIADMIRAIREGGTPLVDGQAGRQPVVIILAIYELHASSPGSTAPMIRLAAFADEISPDLNEQIAVLTQEGIGYIELRGVWNTNVLDLSDAQVAEVRQALAAHNIRIASIGSPIGKVPIDSPFDEHMHGFERALTLARTFEAQYVRIFSFYPPAAATTVDGTGTADGDQAAFDWSPHRHEVLRRLHELAARARAAGVVLLHENEKDIYGDTISRCVDLLQNVGSPNLGAVFDSANFIQCGQKPYPEAYVALRPWLRYVHVKDALAEGQVVAAGEGVTRWPELLRRLRADGYEGFFSLEPHLTEAGRFQGFSGPDRFSHASRAFKGLLHEAGWTYA